MNPTRLREIAQQLVNNCSAYQEKIMQSGNYVPCRTCLAMAEELRELAKSMGPHVVKKEIMVEESVLNVGCEERLRAQAPLVGCPDE